MQAVRDGRRASRQTSNIDAHESATRKERWWSERGTPSRPSKRATRPRRRWSEEQAAATAGAGRAWRAGERTHRGRSVCRRRSRPGGARCPTSWPRLSGQKATRPPWVRRLVARAPGAHAGTRAEEPHGEHRDGERILKRATPAPSGKSGKRRTALGDRRKRGQVNADTGRDAEPHACIKRPRGSSPNRTETCVDDRGGQRRRNAGGRNPGFGRHGQARSRTVLQYAT